MPLQHWSELEELNPQLQSLEDLARLSDNYGLIEIKPFRDWENTVYKNKIFKLRLCNAGEILEVTSYTDSVPATGRIQATRLELLIRSIWSVDDRRIVSEEEIANYNKAHSTSITLLEYLRLWIRNLEQLVVERLEAVYDGLTLKQMRRVQGVALCEKCQRTFPEVPKGSQYLKYALGEIICSDCLPSVSATDYDFETSTTVEPSVAPQPATAEAQRVQDESDPSFFRGYFCACGQELDSLEAYTQHRETCPKAGVIQPR